jgi:hypothetical protein
MSQSEFAAGTARGRSVRKFVVLAASALASAFAFSAAQDAGAAERRVAVQLGGIAVHNEGQVARQFDVNIFQKKPHNKERLVDSASVWIGAGGDYRWNRAILGKTYHVQVTAQPSGEISFDESRQVPKDDSGGVVAIAIPIDANAGQEDPRDDQIDQLQQELAGAQAACDARVATVTQGYEAEITTIRQEYDSQLAALKASTDATIAAQQAHIDTLQAQVASLTDQLAQYVKPMIAVRDPDFGGATVVRGTTQVLVASFTLTTSAVQDVHITKLTFDKDKDGNLDLKNMIVKIDGTQFGTTRGGIADGVNAMDFSGSYTLPASSSVTVSVYVDVLSSSVAGTHLTSIDFVNWAANGVDSGTTVAFSGAVLGQDVVVTNP